VSLGPSRLSIHNDGLYKQHNTNNPKPQMAKFFTILMQGAQVIQLDDPGNDSELYVSVGGRNGAGAQVSGVHPGENMPGGGAGADDGHWWNITENQPIRILNHFIWREVLEDGQNSSVGFVFVDQGNGSLDDAKNVAAVIAAGVGQTVLFQSSKLSLTLSRGF
jgi:hypothetical protein